jgi:alpha-L-rhamnosidase
MGATTIWERWDGQKPDSTFQDPGMNSFNHYAYGAIGDWMYRVSAGIEAGKPGYKHIVIQPHITKKLDFSRASLDSPYGTIESGWERKDGKIAIRVTIPANTTATIILPVVSPERITENGVSLFSEKPDRLSGLEFIVIEENKGVVIERGSGEYVFEFTE